MKLYAPSIYTQSYGSLVYQGATSPAAAIDNDKDSFVASPQANPQLVLDAGSGQTRTANSLWLKTAGYTQLQIQHSSPSVQSGVWAIPSDGYLYVEFTEASSRYWRLIFTGTGSIYEAYLCRKILDFDTAEKRPFRVRDPLAADSVIAYRLWNQQLIQYKPADTVDKTTMTLEWEHLASEDVDALSRVWAGPPHQPELIVYPRPSDEPEKIYSAKWASDFQFRNSALGVHIEQNGTETLTLYKQGQAVFEEL